MKSILFFFLSFLSFASDLSIRSLDSAETLPLKDVLKEKTIAVLYQSDCSSCRIQISQLDCLEDDYNIVLLGGFSSEKKLRLEKLKYHKKYKAYLADNEILKALKVDRKATPQTFIFESKRALKVIGRKKCSDILKLTKVNT